MVLRRVPLGLKLIIIDNENNLRFTNEVLIESIRTNVMHK